MTCSVHVRRNHFNEWNLLIADIDESFIIVNQFNGTIAIRTPGDVFGMSVTPTPGAMVRVTSLTTTTYYRVHEQTWVPATLEIEE